MKTYRFTTPLLNFEENNLWHSHINVPQHIASELLHSETQRRVLCGLFNSKPFHAALIPDGLEGWFILINQKHRQANQLKPGDEVEVTLTGDDSEYGMEMPDELMESLLQDSQAYDAFEKLTPGLQRNLIHFVSQVKSSEIRLRRAQVIIVHLNMHKKPDFKTLNQEMKEANQLAKELNNLNHNRNR